VITNKTKNTILSPQFSELSSVFSKALGLMFHTKPKSLIFQFNKEQLIPLHMCFVFFPIDVVFLNSNKKVVEIKENFKPWTYYSPKNKAKYVIELPKDTIKNSRIELNDLIQWEDSSQ